MGEALLSMPIVRKLFGKAFNLATSIEDMIIDLVLSSEPPHEKSKYYVGVALELLEEARKSLSSGDVCSACSRIWISVVLGVKAYVQAKRGIELDSIHTMWLYKDEVARDLGSEFNDLWLRAYALYVGCGNSYVDPSDVCRVLNCAKKFIESLALNLWISEST